MVRQFYFYTGSGVTVLSEWGPLDALRLEGKRGVSFRGGLGKVWGLLVVPLQDIRKPTIVFHAFLIKSELFVAEDGGQSMPLRKTSKLL